MAILDLSKILGKVRNRVDKVGIELEGAWPMPFPNMLKFVPDNSVFHIAGRVVIPKPLLAVEQNVKWVSGEVPSPPLEPSAINSWLKKAWPICQDATCGLHVHMSFVNAKHYELLTKIDYQDTILHYLGEWAKYEEEKKAGTFPPDHHIWGRLAGLNEFCQTQFWPEKQILKTRKIYERHEAGHRYTAVNFCFGMHRTVEIRVLPMFGSVELGMRAVRATIDVTNACLVHLAKKTEVVVEEVVMAPEHLYEEVDQELI